MTNEPLQPSSPPRVLDYDTTPPTRPRWLYVIIALYGILLLTVVAFPIWLACWDGGLWGRRDWPRAADIWRISLFSTPLLLAGITLMIIPVQKRARRPIRRRAIWMPLTGSSILFAALFFFTLWAIQDAFPQLLLGNGGPDPTMLAWYGALLAWAVWAVVFGWMAICSDPISANSRMYKTLATGNFLELVIAVPMHIIARHRTECCAGIPSGIAIGAGAMFAIVILGPAIFFLYYRRWKQTYVNK